MRYYARQLAAWWGGSTAVTVVHNDPGREKEVMACGQSASAKASASASASTGNGALRRFSVAESHSEEELNFPWLQLGDIAWAEVEEPVGSGAWRRCDAAYWAAHGQAVSHEPRELCAAHVRAFVTLGTRTARLLFHFKDGTVLEPTAEWFHAEGAWVGNFGKRP